MLLHHIIIGEQGNYSFSNAGRLPRLATFVSYCSCHICRTPDAPEQPLDGWLIGILSVVSGPI